jgi:hypothetical protein
VVIHLPAGERHFEVLDLRTLPEMIQ